MIIHWSSNLGAFKRRHAYMGFGVMLAFAISSASAAPTLIGADIGQPGTFMAKAFATFTSVGLPGEFMPRTGAAFTTVGQPGNLPARTPSKIGGG